MKTKNGKFTVADFKAFLKVENSVVARGVDVVENVFELSAGNGSPHQMQIAVDFGIANRIIHMRRIQTTATSVSGHDNGRTLGLGLFLLRGGGRYFCEKICSKKMGRKEGESLR